MAVQTLTLDAFIALKHPLQRRRFALALFFSLILFPLIAAGLLAGTLLLLVPAFGLLIWATGRVWYARFMGNSILVSELNYPRIFRISEELKSVIGYDKPVDVFVYEQGNFNAGLIKFFFYRRAVFLNSELLEAGVTDDELRWLIGRFIGYLKARQMAGFWGWTIRAAEKLVIFNVFILPYERALNYSGDRIALGVIEGDISSSVSAMQKLLVGRQLGYSVNPSGIIDQHRRVKGSFFAFMARVASAFPHMTSRYVDLIECAQERYPAQFARFDAENPGLPADLRQLASLPQAAGAAPLGKDPVLLPLGAAVLIYALLAGIGIIASGAAMPHWNLFGKKAVTPAPIETPAAAAAPPFVSTAGRFTVQFPSTPAKSSKQVNLATGGAVTLYQFQDQEGSVGYVVMYTDYPASLVSGDPQTMLSNVSAGWAKSLKAPLGSDEPTSLNGVPERAFRVATADGTTYYADVFLSGRRLYQVIATVAEGGSAIEGGEFLQSFQIQ